MGEFSKMGKTTVKTRRYYDEAGLLKPEEIDSITNDRFYSTHQLVALHRIQALRQVGLSIDEIKLILSGHNEEAILLKRKAELTAELTEGHSQLSRIEFILQGREKESFMSYVATIKDLPEYIVYSKKMTAPDYNACFELIPAVGKQIASQYPDLRCASPEYCIVIYLDGEYIETDINIELCEAVEKMWPDFDDIHFKVMEQTTVVSVMHKGPYSSIRQAYAFAFEWIRENGFTITDNPRESYIDGIWNKDSEEDWLTEVQVPIVKKP